jgi:hypothetical protein
MKPFRLIFLVLLLCLALTGSHPARAEERQEMKEGAYLVVEGYVKQMSARILVMNDQQYPISMFARVFDANGTELSLQSLANVGKIDRARIYLLGGKIEKIIVLKNI